MIGQTLNNRYTVTTRLGEGAMGTVYRATDSHTGQEVALKAIARMRAASPDALLRFKREAEALRQLNHPNIVGFVDSFEHDGQFIIVMEYIPGGSLHDLIKQGSLPVERARRIALELCDALTRAHHQHIIHRDLKPENILITKEGAPKLTDFGVAKLVEGSRLTGTGTQVGTPYYMSPEAWEGKPLDAQADIWSLGIVFYEMLSGEVPFGGDTLIAVMNKVLTAPLPDIKKKRPDVPDGLARIVRQMLARKKTDRYQTMRQVAADIERGAPISSGSRLPTPPAASGWARIAFAVAAVGFAAVALLCGGIWAANVFRAVANAAPTQAIASPSPVARETAAEISAIATTQPTPTTASPNTPEAAPPPRTEKVVVTWWTNETSGDIKAHYQTLIDEYTAAYPNVSIELTNVDDFNTFNSQIDTAMASGQPPDLFRSYAGSSLNDYAKAGLLKDITTNLDQDGWRDMFIPAILNLYSYEGRNYGVPRDVSLVGFWYNKDLFAQAGIDTPPATWSELLLVVQQLKDAGITPIALGESDKWPGHFWWAYLATRIGGEAGFAAAASRTGSFADPPFVQAGEKLRELIDLDPFQTGFVTATYGDQETLMGNGQAAMELMGSWSPSVQAGNSSNGQGIGDKLGWFPFPVVEGGAGAATDVFGGVSGFVVGKDAEPEAVDFLKYLSSVDSQRTLTRLNGTLPVVRGAEDALTDPFLKIVQEDVATATYLQQYYDQALPQAVGSVMNDSVQGLFTGTLSPEEAAQAIEDSAAQELK